MAGDSTACRLRQFSKQSYKLNSIKPQQYGRANNERSEDMALLQKKSVGLRPALRLALGCIAVALCSCSAFAGTFTAFGPKTYAAGSKPPTTFSNAFSILNPNTQYTL